MSIFYAVVVCSVLWLDLLGAQTPPQVSAKASVVVMETSMGTLEIELVSETALPETVKNFLEYVKTGFYNGTIFHRSIDQFMVQGGGFTENMQEKSTRASIKNEAHLPGALKNEPGTIAMARTSEPHSATAQFYINVAPNNQLDHKSQTDSGWGYVAFGKVISGMHVVNRISKLKTGKRGPHENVPNDVVLIKHVKLKE
jgi:peptidyl-prolyl cis-trans isomerase B (cyclophilin B)